MIALLVIGVDMVGSGRGQLQVTIPVYAWRDMGILQQSLLE
jgi:hypothetical protein